MNEPDMDTIANILLKTMGCLEAKMSQCAKYYNCKGCPNLISFDNPELLEDNK